MDDWHVTIFLENHTIVVRLWPTFAGCMRREGIDETHEVLLANREPPEKLAPARRQSYGILGMGLLGDLILIQMIHLSVREWEIVGATAGVAGLGGAAWWLLTRRRPTDAELEHARRELLDGLWPYRGRPPDGSLPDRLGDRRDHARCCSISMRFLALPTSARKT